MLLSEITALPEKTVLTIPLTRRKALLYIAPPEALPLTVYIIFLKKLLSLMMLMVPSLPITPPSIDAEEEVTLLPIKSPARESISPD